MSLVTAVLVGSIVFGWVGVLALRWRFVPIAIVSPIALLMYLHWNDLLRMYETYRKIGLIDGKAVAFISIQYVFLVLLVLVGAILAAVIIGVHGAYKSRSSSKRK